MRSPSTYSSTRYGWPAGGDAGIDQAGDVRVREPGKDAAFALEALAAGAADQRALSSLTATSPAIAAVAAPGEPDAAHAALADRPLERVGAEVLPGQARGDAEIDADRTEAAGHEARRRACGVIGQQAPDLVGQIRLALGEASRAMRPSDRSGVQEPRRAAGSGEASERDQRVPRAGDRSMRLIVPAASSQADLRPRAQSAQVTGVACNSSRSTRGSMPSR